MNYFFYNEKANNGNSARRIEEVRKELAESNVKEYDLLSFNDYSEFLKQVRAEDTIHIIGGDGTINHFINSIDTDSFASTVYYYPAGSGNDFSNDVQGSTKMDRIKLNHYLKNLPVVTVNDKEYYFINGIGFGIDGYCCEEGDKCRAKNKKKINYSAIAVKGVLGKFKPKNATVKVDGHVQHFKKVWLAPTMMGKFYGGGMMVAPKQDRENSSKTVTTVIVHNVGKLKLLTRFSSIFSGTHLKFTDMVTNFIGHDIEVEFDKPCALQVDGETILNVTKYRVRYN